MFCAGVFLYLHGSCSQRSHVYVRKHSPFNHHPDSDPGDPFAHRPGKGSEERWGGLMAVGGRAVGSARAKGSDGAAAIQRLHWKRGLPLSRINVVPRELASTGRYLSPGLRLYEAGSCALADLRKTQLTHSLTHSLCQEALPLQQAPSLQRPWGSIRAPAREGLRRSSAGVALCKRGLTATGGRAVGSLGPGASLV